MAYFSVTSCVPKLQECSFFLSTDVNILFTEFVCLHSIRAWKHPSMCWVYQVTLSHSSTSPTISYNQMVVETPFHSFLYSNHTETILSRGQHEVYSPRWQRVQPKSSKMKIDNEERQNNMSGNACVVSVSVSSCLSVSLSVSTRSSSAETTPTHSFVIFHHQSAAPQCIGQSRRQCLHFTFPPQGGSVCVLLVHSDARCRVGAL